MLETYEKVYFTLTFPSVFDHMYGSDANFEMAASNTIQPLRLLYIHNIVTHTLAVIFINGAKHEYFRKSVKEGKQLLSDKLKFDEVRTYADLSKSQMIEKMDLLQCEVDCFDAKKKRKPERHHWIQLLAIFNIGFNFNVETDESHKREAEKNGLVKPKKAADGSKFCQ